MSRSFALAATVATLAFSSATLPGAEARADEPGARALRAPVPLDGIAAIVEDVIIFRSEVAARIRRFEPRLSRDPLERRAERAGIEKQAVALMIDEVLILRDATKLHIEVSDEELSTALASIAKADNVVRKAIEAEALERGFKLAEYQEDLRRQLLQQRWLLFRAAGKIDRSKANDAVAFQAALDKQRELLLVDLRSRAYIEIR